MRIMHHAGMIGSLGGMFERGKEIKSNAKYIDLDMVCVNFVTGEVRRITCV
jgi:hypothetical protein